VAIIQSDTDDGTASDKRSTARPAMEAVGNFVLVFAFGIAIATHSWFAPLLIGAPLVAMVSSRNRVPDAYYNPSLTFCNADARSDCIPRRPPVLAHPVGFRTVGGDAGVCDGRSEAAGGHSGDREGLHSRGGVSTRTGLHHCAVLCGR